MGDPAPLISIPKAPAPDGARAEWFFGADGVRLRAALFPPVGPARGSVVVSPGRTEPLEKYFEVARDLTARGLVVLAHDWRGQGLSDRLTPHHLKGHAWDADEFLSDHGALLDTFGPRLPKPWIALGHSMGGCLALLDLARGEARFAGAALSAPMLAIALGPLPLPVARVVGALMSRIAPTAHAAPAYDPLKLRFETDALTHDRARFERYMAQLRAYPDLALGAPTWGWLDFALSAGHELASPGVLERVSTPVAIVGAGADRLVLTSVSRTAAARLPAGRYAEAPGAFHEILMETDERRAVFWTAFDALLAEVTSPSG